MSFGFPPKRPIFPFLVPISIPFGNGKLAQERSAFAQKRNTMNFLILSRREPVFSCCEASIVGLFPQTPARPEVEVSLDAAETKLEDCQRDIGKNLRNFPDDCLNWVQKLRPSDQRPGESRSFFSNRWLGNV